MKFAKEGADVFYTAGLALDKTTHLCFAAHQDDIEIMAFAPVLECYGMAGKWFTGVTVTDGAGSPRCGVYSEYSDEQMKQVRKGEQNAASIIGKYLAQFQLNYSSMEAKDTNKEHLVCDIVNIIMACKPEIIYTHNLADKHDTHVAVALRVIEAVCRLKAKDKPKQLISLEVWRGLDWLCDKSKLVLNTAGHENIASALLGVYDSQIAGGKRYDLAAIGRRLANATFYESHQTDCACSVSYGLDISPLMDGGDPIAFIQKQIHGFSCDIVNRIGKFYSRGPK